MYIYSAPGPQRASGRPLSAASPAGGSSRKSNPTKPAPNEVYLGVEDLAATGGWGAARSLEDYRDLRLRPRGGGNAAPHPPLAARTPTPKSIYPGTMIR